MWPFTIFWHAFRLSVWFSTQPLVLWSPCLHNWRLASSPGQIEREAEYCDRFFGPKPFDNVRHQNLLQCLQNAGNGGTVLRWIHHFLTDRYYQLIGPGAHTRDSNLRFMSNKGVPQGSVLGPLLFNVYVSWSLHDAARAKNVSLPSFADDFTLYSIRPTMTEAADAATSALQDISILLEEKGLTISEEKTASMMIASSFSTNTPKPLMYLNNSPISSCTPRSNCWWKSDLVSPHRCSSQTDLSKNWCSATNHAPANICFSTAISDLSDSTGLWVCCSCVRSIDVYVWETTSASAVEKSCSLRCDGRLENGYCNFTNFRCVKISVASDHGAFGLV